MIISEIESNTLRKSNFCKTATSVVNSSVIQLAQITFI